MKERDGIISYRKLHHLTEEGLAHDREYKILIVDDNVYDAELIAREMQRQSQLRIISKTVTDKESYIEALRIFLPDVVYCDFNITPDFSGVDAVRTLKHDFPDVPFVLVTGALNEEVASICSNEGIDDYLLKSNMARLPVSMGNAIKIRKIELQKKEAYEKLVRTEMQVRNFAQHLNHVLEEERASIAREIHDELGQQLAGIKIGLSTLKKLGYAGSGIEEKAEGMMQDVDVTIQCLRKIATALRPGILDSLGLIPSLSWLANEFEKKSNIRCIQMFNTADQMFEKNISTCFFRICQEALTNISKHAEASEVSVRVDQHANTLVLTVSDNGKGIASDKLENPFSMGLLGMRERAGIVGARLQIQSEKNKGTTIQLNINLPEYDKNIISG